MGKLSKISCFFAVVVFYIFHYCLLNFVVLFFLNPREIGGGGGGGIGMVDMPGFFHVVRIGFYMILFCGLTNVLASITVYSLEIVKLLGALFCRGDS